MSGVADGRPRGRRLDLGLLRRLRPYVRPHRLALALSLGLMLPVSAVQLVQPAILKVVIDQFIVLGTSDGLGLLALAFLGALVAEQGLSFLQIYLLQWVGQRTMMDLQTELHAHVLRLGRPFYDRTPVGSLVTRMTSDVEALNEFFASGAVTIVSDLVLLLAIVVTMLVVDAPLALVALACIPFLGAASALYGVLLRRSQRLIRARLSELNGRLEEDIVGMPVVQAFGREEDRALAFEAANEAHFEANRMAIRWDSQLFAVVEAISSVAIAAVVWYGAGRIEAGILAFGVLKMFMQYILRFFTPIRDMSMKFTVIQSAMAAAERIFGLLDERPTVLPPEVPAELPAFRDRVRFDGVTFSYDGRTPVLGGLSFEVRRGERVAIVGATGAGKSSVVKLLTRQYDVTGGAITIDGVDLRHLAPERLAALVTLVPQEVVLFSDSVLENVRLGDARLGDDAVRHAVRAVGAEGFVLALPRGYEELLSGRGGSLSSGERQLLSYARALARDPEVLVLDEATSSIDAETERLIDGATERLLTGRTAIVIAHRLSTVRKVDRILVLHHGELREEGTHEELLARGGLYAALHDLQSRPIDYGRDVRSSAGKQ